jgi:predicted MPP superfamily phosphohydrolase
VIRAFIFIAILFVIDLYAFQAVRFTIKNLNPSAARIICWSYWAVSAICFGLILLANFTDWHLWPKALRTYSFAMIFILFFSKLMVVVFLLTDDVIRALRYAGIKTVQAFNPADKPVNAITRAEFLVKAGLIAGAIPFFSLIWGMLYGVYQFTVRKVKIGVKDLPGEFLNFRIIQISDLHTGSFQSGEPLQKAVNMINRLKPDVIFFTGDLVNDRHIELLPYLETLKSLKARFGIYSVLGNHDYGDYYRWPSEEDKRDNLQKLIGIQKQLGWKLLMDEHDYIDIAGKKIAVAGVQNWSGRAGFQRYGNLEKAIKGINGSFLNILLTHDPSHWRKEVLKHQHIHLTLSGHTHGMQFGIEVPGWKWSPAQYFYKEWAGLYAEGHQKLYVNRGLGFIGYPGRVGIMPEITLIELIPQNSA